MLFLQLPDSTNTSAEYLVRNYTVEDGLPVNAVSDIVQDDNGYLYFSTLNGLARYDGYEFVTYNASNSPGITTNRFNAIRYSSTDDLWLFSETGEVTLYRDHAFHTFDEEDGVTEDVLTWDEGPTGDIWIGTRTGFFEFSSDSHSFQKPISEDLPKLPTHSIVALNGSLIGINSQEVYTFSDDTYTPLFRSKDLAIDHTGSLLLERIDDNHALIHGRETLIVFNAVENKYHEINIAEMPTPKYWQAKRIEGQIILSTSEALFEIDLSQNKLIPKTAEEYSFTNRPNIVKEESGTLHAIGDHFIVNGKRLRSVEGVDASFMDSEGSVWVATRHDGLKQYRQSNITNITSVQNKPLQNVYPIIQGGNGDIWAGSFISGVYRFRGESVQHWDKYNSNLVENRVRFLFEDHDETIFVSLWDGGLWKFDEKEWNRVSTYDAYIDGISPVIEAMFRMEDGSLIIGTQGPTIIDRSGEVFTLEDLVGTKFSGVRTIAQREDGMIFLGSNGNGLGILKPDDSFKQVTENHGLSSNFIRDIFIQSTDTVWLATENRGLNRLVFNSKDSLTSVQGVSTRDGLTNNALHRIIKDNDSNFWISSNQGIMKISLPQLNHYLNGTSNQISVVSYDQKNGMVNSEANGGVQSAGVLTTDQKIWFPNQKGITIIDPNISEAIHTSGTMTPVIEQISFSDTTILTADIEEITVSKDARNFSIHFTAPNFAFPERTVFKYKLAGVHDNWVTADQSQSAFFTNMDPGTYQFEVQSEVAGGSVSMASLLITIPPYFYETVYFQLLMGLCVIGIGFLMYRYRVHSLKAREKELQKRVKDQTQQLEQAAEEKSRFFTGITHELKTPLSLILGPLDEFIQQKSPKSDQQFQRYLQMMHRNGYRLKNLVDQILDVSKLNADAIKLDIHPYDMETLTRQISGQFQSLLDQKGITLEIQSDAISELIYVDKEAWERIIINLLSNAIKFSPEGGRIILSLEDEPDNVLISIKDFGKGISAKDQKKVFDYLYQSEGEKAAEGTGVGLYLVKGLIERMGGEVKLRSEEQKGAEFILVLQKGSEHFMKEDHLSHEPVKLDACKPSVSKSSTSKPKNDDKKATSGKTLPSILIVEDNPDFRQYMTSVLEDEYRISVANNGEEGLSIIEEIKPDIVISDVMMPVMGGFEFVSELRKLDGFKKTPVIFLSAKDQDVDIQRGLSTGADIYLTKPIRSSTLISQIKAVLRREDVLRKADSFATQPETDEPELVSKLREIVYRQLGNPNLTVDMIADKLYMSRAKLYRSWKPVSDLSVTEFIKEIRYEEAIVLIKQKGFSVQDAAQAVGFSDPNYFSSSFKKEFGYSPSELKS